MQQILADSRPAEHRPGYPVEQPPPKSVAFQLHVIFESMAMKTLMIALSVAGFVGLSTPTFAQDADFSLTYHVDRTPASKLSIEACGRVATQVARQSKLGADTQSFPRQLVLVKGGHRGAGVFTVQCIAVGTTTVSVVQGIDYRASKGALGNFADTVFAALKRAAK